MYTSGFLHRDPSSGNVLTIPAAKKEFEIPEEFFAGLSDEVAKEVRELCSKVEKAVAELGISTEHSAVITDGDLSVSWRDYWEDASKAAKSVSCFHVTHRAGLDEVCRARPSSCPGRSWTPQESIYIHLWMTWSLSSGLRSGTYSTSKADHRRRQKK